jgi:hypothetical protein
MCKCCIDESRVAIFVRPRAPKPPNHTSQEPLLHGSDFERQWGGKTTTFTGKDNEDIVATRD